MNLMSTTMVSVTQAQRNFKAILDNLSSTGPTLVLRDSIPEAVLIHVGEYKRLIELEKERLNLELKSIMNDLASKNSKYSDKEMDKDIEYAKKHAPRSN